MRMVKKQESVTYFCDLYRDELDEYSEDVYVLPSFFSFHKNAELCLSCLRQITRYTQGISPVWKLKDYKGYD